MRKYVRKYGVYIGSSLILMIAFDGWGASPGESPATDLVLTCDVIGNPNDVIIYNMSRPYHTQEIKKILFKNKILKTKTEF